jgi:GrpB-like predicted nucleotidyltransferase (UPF0157 family)
LKEDLNRLSFEALGKLFPIVIVDYDSAWKKLFYSEKQIVHRAIRLNNLIRIEHIGSTAVPGLCAKPTIDLLVEIKDKADTGLIIENLKQIGYHFIPKPENPPPHMMFAKGYSESGFTGQTFHIHLRYRGKQDEVIFRDYLIRNREAADEYAELKKSLSKLFMNDREAYTNKKTDFIKKILLKCREEIEHLQINKNDRI